jgi:WXXGXW repeat (2 copies)
MRFRHQQHMKFSRLLLALVVGFLFPLVAPAQVAVSVSVAPPPLITYSQPACPVDGYIWTPGYWAYDDGDYYWVDGVWVPPPQVGYLWTPGYWAFANGLYLFNTGYWGPRVGFYGGVNYGYGYGGNGYYGGRWQGNRFQYNTAVTRVNTTVIHNTYVNRNFVTATRTRASYNGPGGVTARPTAEQRAAANGPHVSPTSQQLAQRQTAAATKAHRVPARPAGNAAVAANGQRAVNNHPVATTNQNNLKKQSPSTQIKKPATTSATTVNRQNNVARNNYKKPQTEAAYKKPQTTAATPRKVSSQSTSHATASSNQAKTRNTAHAQTPKPAKATSQQAPKKAPQKTAPKAAPKAVPKEKAAER